MYSKTLVVGGAGYVGGWVTELLRNQQSDFIVLDSLLYEDSYMKDVQFKYIDINAHESLLDFLSWADNVIWLAALVGDPACSLNPELTIKSNFESIKFLVDNFNGKIIFLSTCSVYGANNSLLDENSELNPLSLYAESKILAENYILNSKKDAFIFRLGTLYGVSDTYARIRADLVVNILTARAYLENKMSVFGGRQWRPLLHVKDVAHAIISALNSNNFGVYNLHSQNMTILEIAEKIKDFLPTCEILTSEVSFQDSRNYQVTSEKAIKHLGFKPRYNINDGILEILKLLQEGRIKNINSSKFSNALALKNNLTNE